MCEPRTRRGVRALSALGREGVLWALPRPRRLRKLILWACGVRWGNVANDVGGGARRHCETARERVRSHRGL